ncbi:hypothetical protein [Paludisphaera sp.]|uniref:hypothetical protein n=1 Tax=Paludisphaera sp. TaxID=2017432 RepID=UPI00301C1E83
MSTDQKIPDPSTAPRVRGRDKGIKIFMWPKVIYIFPSAVVSLICAIGMWALPDKEYDPSRGPEVVTAAGENAEVVRVDSPKADVPTADGSTKAPGAPITRRERFNTPQNLLGVLFLVVLGFNLVVMGLDFPRFELIGLILAILFTTFFVLWLGSYFDLDLLRPINAMLGSIYVFANAGFYLMYFTMVMIVLAIVYVTRWLDYWEIMPNEILHHHGPLSDLERYPTLNLKFDKEIPDVLEYLLLGAGRLVLQVPNMERAIILENVLFISSKEEALKRLMSRLDVRITTDKDDPLI